MRDSSLNPTDAIGQHPAASDLRRFSKAKPALARIRTIYETATETLSRQFHEFVDGKRNNPVDGATYPYLGIHVTADRVRHEGSMAYGHLAYPGTYGTTLTRPELFEDYYLEQIELLIRNHGPVVVGASKQPIPLPFVLEHSTASLDAMDMTQLQSQFPMPELDKIHDMIANGTFVPQPGEPKPLALFTAPRVDYSLSRLAHYTGTAPHWFQRFVLFTNYQRYVEEFIAYGQAAVAEGQQDITAFVEPGNVITERGSTEAKGTRPVHLPQMPAYHLAAPKHSGITLVNIGVGPSNAKTITDHLAVLRPHCWLMVGHCAGLRRRQRLGDYVLAHAYGREDRVLDQDLPVGVPIPAIAEVQVALAEAVSQVTGVGGAELKDRLRTGTVFTTLDRHWELRHEAVGQWLNQSRAIAVDMESATIAANGFRLRVPYGTLLCVSDKPLHGELKLPGMANAFYQARVGQHLEIGIEAINRLRAMGTTQLHSRKLRSFDEPAFR